MFKDRADAGKLLAKRLNKYKNQNSVVYGLSRGGVVTALEVAKYLKAPLDVIIARKIGHPYHPEYAIGAVSEGGSIVFGNKSEIETLDKAWLDREIERQKNEIEKRKKLYTKDGPKVSATGKYTIVADDGAATGLTLLSVIKDLKKRKPMKIVAAIPVLPEPVATALEKKGIEVIALYTPSEKDFLGTAGSYYKDFLPVENDEVENILGKKYHILRYNNKQ